MCKTYSAVLVYVLLHVQTRGHVLLVRRAKHERFWEGRRVPSHSFGGLPSERAERNWQYVGRKGQTLKNMWHMYQQTFSVSAQAAPLVRPNSIYLLIDLTSSNCCLAISHPAPIRLQ